MGCGWVENVFCRVPWVCVGFCWQVAGFARIQMGQRAEFLRIQLLRGSPRSLDTGCRDCSLTEHPNAGRMWRRPITDLPIQNRQLGQQLHCRTN